MATYYFDPENGLDANSGLSPALAKRSFDVFLAAGSMASSDTALLRRGARHIFAQARAINNGGAGNPTIVGAYGVAQTPYAFLENPTGTGSFVFNLSQRSNIILEDLRFDANAGGVSVYWSSTTLGQAINGIVRRCAFTGTAGGDRMGLYIGRENTTNVAQNFLVEDCEFFDNSASGITLMAVQNAIIRRCKAWGNGWGGPGGGHGIHTQSRHVFTTAGWTLVSGTIYSRVLAAHEVDIFYVRHPNYPAMVKNIATPTTPAIGEFGVSGGLLYVNVNANPNGPTMAYVWATSSNILYEQCEAWRNKFGIAPFQEGHGISFDDWTESSRMVACYSHDNEGLGLSINGGNNNTITSCIVRNNEMRGFSGGSGSGTVVRNCTFKDNNQGRGATINEVGFSATSTGSSTSNNVIVTTRANGIDFGGASGCSSTNDLVSGATGAAVVGATPTGLITTNARPFLEEDGSLRISQNTTLASLAVDNPLALAGIYTQGITLRNGRLRPGYCPVGAYQAVLPKGTKT